MDGGKLLELWAILVDSNEAVDEGLASFEK